MLNAKLICESCGRDYAGDSELKAGDACPSDDCPSHDLEATHLRDGRYAVRPAGQLGTCGWHPHPWSVIYVNARNEQEALKKAQKKMKIPY